MIPDQATHDEQQARALSAAVLIVLSLVVLFVLVVPTLQALRTAQKRTVEARVLLEHARSIVNSYDALYAVIGRNAGAVARMEQALPMLTDEGESDVPALLATIEAIAERDVGGVLLESVSVGGRDELIPRGGDVYVRPLTLRGLAGTESLSRLLDAFRISLALIEPVSLELTYAGEGVATFTLVLERPLFSSLDLN